MRCRGAQNIIVLLLVFLNHAAKVIAFGLSLSVRNEIMPNCWCSGQKPRWLSKGMYLYCSDIKLSSTYAKYVSFLQQLSQAPYISGNNNSPSSVGLLFPKQCIIYLYTTMNRLLLHRILCIALLAHRPLPEFPTLITLLQCAM